MNKLQYQIRFPFNCAADAYLVDWYAKNMVHKRVLEQPAEERSFSVFLLDEPAAVCWVRSISEGRSYGLNRTQPYQLKFYSYPI
jgi:hypothetical protein